MTLRTIDKYELLEELGRGGFAVVYRARDIDLERVVALKVLHPHWIANPQFVTRFRLEAHAAANLHHPNIVTGYEAGEADGQLYIAMAYLPGRALHDLLEEQGPLSLEAALPILEQLADALDYAHGQGVIHRDIKPANVMVEETTAGSHITLMDFGLVKAMESSAALTSQGTLLGSPEYMAPEQADPNRKNEIGPATDRYAFGVVAYRMLAGRVPFPGNTPGTLNAHLNFDVPDPRDYVQDLPPAVTEALLVMLAKTPGDRFPTVCAFVTRLREIADAEQERQAHEEQFASLYDRLEVAWAQKQWDRVITWGERILAVTPDFGDTMERLAHARDELEWQRVAEAAARAQQQRVTQMTSQPDSSIGKRWLILAIIGIFVTMTFVCGVTMGPKVWERLSFVGSSTPISYGAIPSATLIARSPIVVPLGTPQPTATMDMSTPAPYMPRIGIIAGHSASDSGAVCSDGLQEVDVNLDIARRVVALLVQHEWNADLLEEFDVRLNGYQADALLSIHADSCGVPNKSGFKIARAESGWVPEEADALIDCVTRYYAARTGLAFDPYTITYDMTRYHAYYEIDRTTPVAILEIGFLLDDRELLTQHPELVAQGIVDGLVCFIEGESP